MCRAASTLLLTTMTTFPVPLSKFSAHQTLLNSLQNLEPANLPVPNPTRSFWLNPPEVNQLAKDGSEGVMTEDADICIIGSGITGISAAYHLVNHLKNGNGGARNRTKVVVLEARDFCEVII